jgi:hypothetical protein
MAGRPLKDDNKLELTLLQQQFVNAYFEQGESPTKIAKVMKWKDRGRVSCMLRSEKVQIAIAKRKEQIQLFSAGNDTFTISKADRIQVLWDIAQKCTQEGFDREGNRIMVNPSAAIAAIREINLMTGAHAPEQKEMTVVQEKRSEAEIRQSIIELQQEAQLLLSDRH